MEHLEEDNLNQEIIDKLNSLSSSESIFDTIQYNSEEDLNNFINNLTDIEANQCLIQAIVAAYKRGAFTLLESEVISKSLRIIKK
jgi:hypothetical protein